MLLHVSHLTKRYRHVTALDDVSFSIRGGEMLGLIGPNGSGKTTLFECLAGVLPADAGTVSSVGSDFRRTSAGPSEAGPHTIAPVDRSSVLFYLPDAIAPWPAQTVRWALDFTVGFFGVRGVTSNTSDTIRRLGLEPLLDVRIGELSKGQRKRALLAIGLLMPQPLLLADEPFEGLDLRQSRDLAATLRTYAASGRTLFLSIHQISDAARVCDRFVLLSGGRVRGEGSLDELANVANARTGDHQTKGDLEEVFLALT